MDTCIKVKAFVTFLPRFGTETKASVFLVVHSKEFGTRDTVGLSVVTACCCVTIAISHAVAEKGMGKNTRTHTKSHTHTHTLLMGCIIICVLCVMRLNERVMAKDNSIWDLRKVFFFPPSTVVFPVSLLPPVFHTHI